MKTSTQTIAGHSLTLRSGKRYYASRPMAERGMKRFDVTVEPLGHEAPIAVVPGLSYDAANALINAFNDGADSWSGRIW